MKCLKVYKFQPKNIVSVGTRTANTVAPPVLIVAALVYNSKSVNSFEFYQKQSIITYWSETRLECKQKCSCISMFCKFTTEF